jgi:hypothetical protein
MPVSAWGNMSAAPVVCRSAWMDGAATLAIVASACAMKGAMSRTASSRLGRVGVVGEEAMPMRRATRLRA